MMHNSPISNRKTKRINRITFHSLDDGPCADASDVLVVRERFTEQLQFMDLNYSCDLLVKFN